MSQVLGRLIRKKEGTPPPRSTKGADATMWINKHHAISFAFTLSELLVSLAVIGLISAFAIPKVINSVEASQKKIIFRETIAVIQDVYNTCLLDESCIVADYNELYNRLNAVKICDTTTTACVTNPSVESGSINRDGAIFQTGAYMWGFARSFDDRDGFAIDFNGTKPPNLLGEDILWLVRCNLKDNTVANYSPMMKDPLHGKIGPYLGSPESVALYNAIYN
jgi:prepilin-type N-terminal cleavage/methylation domain-containing protein